MSNKNSKHFKRFKRLSVPIGTVDIELKTYLIKQYLEMRNHLNAAIFFKHYGDTHPEFDSTEHCEKRNKLAADIKKELFYNINTAGLDDTAKQRQSKFQDLSVPNINKKGSPVSFGIMSKKLAMRKKNRSTIVEKPQNKLMRLQKMITSIGKKSNIPKYEYKPDKITLRMLIMRAVTK